MVGWRRISALPPCLLALDQDCIGAEVGAVELRAWHGGGSLGRRCCDLGSLYLAEASGAGGQQGPTELLHGADSSWEGWGREDSGHQVEPEDPGQHFLLAPGDRNGGERVLASHKRILLPHPAPHTSLTQRRHKYLQIDGQRREGEGWDGGWMGLVTSV